MAVKAAITGDTELLKLSVLQDPLVSTICSTNEVWQMIDEMLVAQEKWLPQYKNKIKIIKKKIPKLSKSRYSKSVSGVKKQTNKKNQKSKKRSVFVEKEAFNL
jgi:alpha-galactosidase